MTSKNKQKENPKDKKLDISLSEMIKLVERALISDDKELVEKAFKAINSNEGDWPWVRAGVIMHAWEGADAKGREEFCMINIRKLVEYKALKPLKKTFVDDETGIEYRLFKYKNGRLERIPIATDTMGKTAYDVALNKKFSGDYVTFTSSDKTKKPDEYLLDTQEKVDDYNNGDWFKKWYIGNRS